MGKRRNRQTRQRESSGTSARRREIPGWVKAVGGVLAVVVAGVIATMLTPWFAPHLEVMGETDPIVGIGGMHVSSDGQSRQLWKAIVCVENAGLFSGSLKSARPAPVGLDRVPNVLVIGLDRGPIRFRSARPVEASFILNGEPISTAFGFSLELYDEKDRYIGAVVVQHTNVPPTPRPSIGADGSVTLSATVSPPVVPEGMCDNSDE